MAAPAMTKESVRALIDGVENGRRSRSAHILIDRILAHARVTHSAP